MAYDDKDDTKFPTRFGQATGHANERTMLDELGGANGIRHRQRLGADGVTTHVKTRGGHPHFWNEPLPGSDDESVSPIYMDSGVVDLLSINPDSPVSVLASPLYYGTDQDSYYAAEKLLGKITPPEITNPNPPPDTEPGESFTPVVGGDIVGKKDCAAKCPPSMFTGKARLYAQAQLGAPLNKWGWTLDLPEAQPPRWVHDRTGFVLDINVGVYTDDTDKHWLISVSGAGVMVTPLKPSKSAKLLIPNLSDPEYSADRTQIEAYILAHSAPGSASESFFITISGLPAPYMLGYGWKFNWDGSKADIIEHQVGFPWTYSMHHRVNIYRNVSSGFTTEANRWTVDVSDIGGPFEWHNSRFTSVISHPDWTFNVLYIFGSTLGQSKASGVPVYCFYNDEDELEVFSHTHTPGVPGTAAKRDSYPPSWGLTCDWTTDTHIGMNATEYDTFNTFFTDGGGSSWKQRSSSFDSYGFSCGAGSTVGDVEYYSFQDRTTAGKIINNTDVVWGGFGWENNQPFPVADIGVRHVNYTTSTHALSDGVVATTGYMNYLSDNVSGPAGLYQSAFVCFHQVVGLRYDAGTHSESRRSLLVVPFYDSEACYFYGVVTTTRVSSGNSGDGEAHMDNVWGTPLRVKVGDDVVGEWTIGKVHEDSFGTPTENVTTWTDQVTTTSTTLISKLIFSGGEVEFDSPVSLSPFFSGDEYVSQQFHTQSSVQGAVYGFGANLYKGFPDRITISPPPFIGWA
jgi:hypothetical protein